MKIVSNDNLNIDFNPKLIFEGFMLNLLKNEQEYLKRRKFFLRIIFESFQSLLH